MVGGTVSFSGTVIRDGVVIWPKEHIADLLVKAQAKLQQDNARLARIQEEKTRK